MREQNSADAPHHLSHKRHQKPGVILRAERRSDALAKLFQKEMSC